MLYHLWWGYGSGQGKKTHSENTGADSRNTVAAGDSSSDVMSSVCEHQSNDVIGSSAAASDCSSGNDSSRGHVQTLDSADQSNTDMQKAGSSPCKHYSREEIQTLFTGLQYISGVLLSDAHANYTRLKRRLNSIQTCVATLVVKHKPDGNPAMSTPTLSSPVSCQIDCAASDETMIGLGENVDDDSAKRPYSVTKAADIDGSEGRQDQDLRPKTRTDKANVDQTSLDIPSSDGRMSVDGTGETGLTQAVSLKDETLPNSLIELTAMHAAVKKEIDAIPVEIKVSPYSDSTTFQPYFLELCKNIQGK